MAVTSIDGTDWFYYGGQEPYTVLRLVNDGGVEVP